MSLPHPGRTARIVGAAALLVSGGRAVGQANPDAVRALERQLRDFDATYRVAVPADQPIAERILVDAGGTLRFGFYSIDDELSHGHVLRQYDGRLFARVELDGAHRFFGRLRFQWDDWNDGDSFDGEGDDFNDPVVERAWYEFDLRGLERAKTGVSPDYNFNVRGGKQFITWGSGLTLSAVMWAGLVQAEAGSLAFTGIGGITSSQDVVDFDGSRPDFDDHTDRIYGGGQVEYRFEQHTPYAFFLAQIDDNTRDMALVGGIPTRFGYDSQYLGLGSKGALGADWSYRVELVKQFGRTYSSPFTPGGGAVPQTRDDIDAYAGLLGLTYLLRDASDSRLDIDILGGSGDDDRFDSSDTFGGNAPGTTDHAFNSLGYVNTGVALAPEPSNLLAFRAGFSTNPFNKTPGFFEGLRVGIDGYFFAKIDEDAPISALTVPGERVVGGEVDLFADWRITSDVTINTRYGVFFAGDAMPATQDQPRQFFYVGVTYAF